MQVCCRDANPGARAGIDLDVLLLSLILRCLSFSIPLNRSAETLAVVNVCASLTLENRDFTLVMWHKMVMIRKFLLNCKLYKVIKNKLTIPINQEFIRMEKWRLKSIFFSQIACYGRDSKLLIFWIILSCFKNITLNVIKILRFYQIWIKDSEGNWELPQRPDYILSNGDSTSSLYWSREFK